MNLFSNRLLPSACVLALLFTISQRATASVDDAQSFALQAA
ncbi:MAG: hypothetical protein ABIR71_06170 [Chthoniobacterales bacterium]